MRLYSGMSTQFFQDTIQNQIADKLKNAFFDYFRYNPSSSEVNSWRNSLRAITQVFQNAQLDDHGIILEYQIPLTSKRLDCMVLGKDQNGLQNAVIVELKQWEKCLPSELDNVISTWLGGANRDLLHPSVQVGQYCTFLRDVETVFYDPADSVKLSGCSYLHNYGHHLDDPIFATKFSDVISDYPVFTGDDVTSFSQYLRSRLELGQGLDVLNNVEHSKYRPSKKLMEHVAGVIHGRSEYTLLDEQRIVYERVLSSARVGFHDKKKTIVVVKGGPGTGKSVIAINLMADLMQLNYNAHYATGSRAFTETLRSIVGRRANVQFKYFNSYGKAESNAVDVLLLDEAHRIRETSNNMYTPAASRTLVPQVEELAKAAKVLVFFIDDNQVVRPGEIGSTEYVLQYARGHDYKIYEYQLEAQFRCGGSDAFVNWINNTLQIQKTATVLWPKNEAFDFKIFDSPLELENAILEKSAIGNSARMTAGFCWKWSQPNSDGTLVNDVAIGEFLRPWNAKPEATHLAPGIPKAVLWANDPNGIKQIGCVYSAQGFEFDYVGVIFGKDLVYDFEKQTWIGNKSESKDTKVRQAHDSFLSLVKNTYRVLLSRGLKGCYVHFQDKETEKFFRSRIETT